MTLGEKIRERMEKLGITPEELSEASDIKNWVMNLVLDDKHYPSKTQFSRLGKALHITEAKLDYDKSLMVDSPEKPEKSKDGIYFVEYAMRDMIRPRYDYCVYDGGWYFPRYGADGSIIGRTPARVIVKRWLKIK
jgi:transcriptional regulator with XRE-family HTH domain